MFSALTSDDRRICLLDFSSGDPEAVRGRARGREYRCPICLHAVFPRMGHRRQWHFAHVHEAPDSCPLKHVHAEIERALVAMYHWLKTKAEVLDLQPHYVVPEHPDAEPIEIYFTRRDRKYLYKILKARVGEDLIRGYESLRPEYVLNYVFLAKSVREDDGLYRFGRAHRLCLNNAVLLTLDAGREVFIRYGDCERAHWSRSLHAAAVEEIPLHSALIHPETGDIVRGSKVSAANDGMEVS